LLALGPRWPWVEPFDEMRAQLTAAVPGVKVISGSAEAMPLLDGSADVVVSAQAFPLFRPAHALSHRPAVRPPVRTMTPHRPPTRSCSGRVAVSRSCGTRATIATRGWPA